MFLPNDGWSSPSENLESFISVVKLIFKSIFHKRAAPRWCISSFHQRCCCFSHCKFCIWWWWWCGDCACKQGWNERCLMWWTAISSGPPPRPAAVSFTPPLSGRTAANTAQLPGSCPQHTLVPNQPRRAFSPYSRQIKIDLLMTNSWNFELWPSNARNRVQQAK